MMTDTNSDGEPSGDPGMGPVQKLSQGPTDGLVRELRLDSPTAELSQSVGGGRICEKSTDRVGKHWSFGRHDDPGVIAEETPDAGGVGGDHRKPRCHGLHWCPGKAL